jgi:hypothetical protein
MLPKLSGNFSNRIRADHSIAQAIAETIPILVQLSLVGAVTVRAPLGLYSIDLYFVHWLRSFRSATASSPFARWTVTP